MNLKLLLEASGPSLRDLESKIGQKLTTALVPIIRLARAHKDDPTWEPPANAGIRFRRAATARFGWERAPSEEDEEALRRAHKEATGLPYKGSLWKDL